MTISEAHELLNFFVDKYSGAYYTPAEFDKAIDDGQLQLFSEWLPLYATSQVVKDALAPFMDAYAFGYNDSLLGAITVPANRNYRNLLSLHVYYDISARSLVRYVPVKLINKDELAYRLNSQVDPVAATSPVGEQVGAASFQLWPKVQYRGTVDFLRRPVAPSYAYTTISGRVQVYDAANSVQLEWADTYHHKVLWKALSMLGINLQEADVIQYAELKNKQ
jgi:hypothetical protein